MDLSNLLEVPADLSDTDFDGVPGGLLFDAKFFNFETLDDPNTLSPNRDDGRAAQGEGMVKYERPNFFPFCEMPQTLKPRASQFSYLRKVASGVLNMGNLSEASDQALLIELDRALQLITAQQQFLIEQAQVLDQWLKHMCPNEKTDPVEGFNVPELMTLDDVNIMENIPKGLLQSEMPSSKQKCKSVVPSLQNRSSKLSSKMASNVDNTHISSLGQQRNAKWNETSKSGGNRGSQESMTVVGTSKQRKKDKNSNHNIVNGGSAAAYSPSTRSRLYPKKHQNLQMSSLATAEPGRTAPRLIKVKVKCQDAESLPCSPLFAQIPILMSEPSNVHSAPSYSHEKITMLIPGPKAKGKDETPRKKVEAAQPPTVKGMWDWVAKEGYFKECTGAELDWMELQPDYISPNNLVPPEVKKPPFSKSCTLSVKTSEGAAALEYAACNAHIMTAPTSDSEIHTTLKGNNHKNSFMDRLMFALLPTKQQQQQHSKDAMLVNHHPPAETTVQNNYELDLDALTDDQRLSGYLCMIGLLSTQGLQDGDRHGSHYCDGIDGLQMLAEELGRLNCKNNQRISYLKDRVLKETEKQCVRQVERVDSMAKVQKLKELMKRKKKQKNEIREQQQKALWPW